jgi:ABC-type transporter MlaC component
MIEIIASFFLVTTGAEAERSLTAPPSLGSANAVSATPIAGSKMLFAVSTPKPGSASKFIVESIVAVEKLMEDVSETNEVEIKKRDPQMRKIISSILDLDGLGKLALSTHWSEIEKTAAGRKQLDRYLQLFRQLVEENYLEKIRVYIGGKYQITFLGETTDKRGTIVQASIKKKDADLIVEFQAWNTTGKWVVRDVRLDETSLQETYRGSFNRIIKKHGGVKAGFPELLKVMEKRLVELKKGKATKL